MIASRFINFFLIFIVAELLILVLLTDNWKNRKIWGFFCCLISILIIVSVCFFPFPFQSELVDDMVSGGLGVPNNYIPFKTIWTTISEGLRYKVYSSIIYQLIGNVILCVPLGVSLYFFTGGNKIITKTLFSVFLVSVSIEALQGLFNYLLQINYRSIDIDDVILNVIGGGIGFNLGRFIEESKKRRFMKPDSI